MNDDPLAQLRDIHLPADAGWWPPAIGWWVLAGLILAGLAALALWLLRRHRRQAWRRQALAELNDLANRAEPSTEWVVELNQLLKRVAARCYPERSVARMTGTRWSDFLTATLPPGTDSEKANSVFSAMAESAYSPRPNVKPPELILMARTWIRGQSC